MAKFDSPVKVKRGDVVREVGSDAALTQAVWDGFALIEDAPEPLTEEEANELSPQQKAARTRKQNAAEKAAGATEATTTVEGGAVVPVSTVSGDTADGESTAGSNPS